MRANAFAMTALLTLATGTALSFTAGSTGADGALTIPAGDGSPQTILFDPASFAQPLDTDGDGVYHFTTITIPANITLRLTADRCGTLPLHWLATGDVLIAGTLDLSATSVAEVNVGSLPPASIPGPGGFPGGLGQTPGEPGPQPGFGPGGGSFAVYGGSYATSGYPFVGTLYGNGYLLPLIGGSGGAGGGESAGKVCSGGAGGGAILIASDTQVILGGQILSLGGFAMGYAADGSGGAVRIMAPTFSGTGSIDVDPTDTRIYVGGAGWIRVEANSNNFTGTYDGVLRAVTLSDSSPTGVSDPRTRILVTSVGGTAIPPRPNGSFQIPDATVNTSASVDIDADVFNAPADAVDYTLYLFNETTFQLTLAPTTTTDEGDRLKLHFETPLSSGFTRGFVMMTPQ